MPTTGNRSARGAPIARPTVIDPSDIVSFPASFIRDIAPNIRSMEELQVSLAFFRTLEDAGGFAQPIPEKSLLRDRNLRGALRVEGSPRAPDTRIAKGLELALARGTLIRLVSSERRRQAVFYYLNTPENRSSIRLMETGELAPPRALWPDDSPPQIVIDRPNAFRLYEQNIGPLTPLIADQISRAIEDYPDDWIEDALTEAVSYNRRSWRYVSRILENWQAAGRSEDRD
ncbi:MAG TPA: DnaD domain protein [Thermomicrobiales bacterium]|nr:DnaD domain protein [Thermomicrobiales bacterium]